MILNMLFYAVIIMYFSILVFEFYNKYFRRKNLSLFESESITYRYIELLRHKKAKLDKNKDS